jgi:hypothetical protein
VATTVRVSATGFCFRAGSKTNEPTVPRFSTMAELVANFLLWALFCSFHVRAKETVDQAALLLLAQTCRNE